MRVDVTGRADAHDREEMACLDLYVRSRSDLPPEEPVVWSAANREAARRGLSTVRITLVSSREVAPSIAEWHYRAECA